MMNSHKMPLAADPIDRAAHLRADTAWQINARISPDSHVLMMQLGQPLLERGGAGLAWRPANQASYGEANRYIFLGLDNDGAPVFAQDMPETFSDPDLEPGKTRFVLANLSARDANLVSTARSLFEWHRNHTFCARCGEKSTISDAGWKRVCPACGAVHFPRTDPVAIMLVTRGEDCLLGRQSNWPPRMWSCLAGFVEPGETVEQAAARETLEESGIQTDPATAQYLFCQPWPFPSSLMIGLSLKATSKDIKIDDHELEAARWFNRQEIRDMLNGHHQDADPPMSMAVAHHLLKAWAFGDM